MSPDSAAAAVVHANRAAAARLRTGSGLSGRLLVLLSVVPALLATAWLVASVPLAAFGAFRPVTAVASAVVVAALIVPLGVGVVGRPVAAIETPWWTVLTTVAIAVGFASFAAATHSEHAILRRDAGAYAQIGYWLTGHTQLTYHLPLAAFGPSPGDLTFASPAFYQHGHTVVPQFMTGWPTMLAGAGWVGGWHAMFVLPALVGGFGILAVAGLAARLVGARWAPLAALLMAVAWPVLRVSQTTYSEPLALLLLAGGICLLTDLLIGRKGLQDRHRGRVRGLAFAAGLVLASGELVRLDFGVDLALVVPVIGWLWARRQPGALPFIGGALIGGLLGVADCVFVTSPYVEANWSSVRLMIVAMVGVTAVTVAVAVALRRWGRPLVELRWWRWVPGLGAAAVVAVAAGLVVRPYVTVDHSTSDQNVITYTAQMQGWLGLPADGTRGYAEQSLWWVSWYLGWPLLIAALVAAAVLTWRVLRGRERAWLAALLVFVGSTVQTLVRPGITPDHPWADRRLVVEVIPGAILLATWTTAVTVRLMRALVARNRDKLAAGQPGILGRLGAAARRAFPAAVAVAMAAVFLVPMAVAAAPVATKRTEVGEVAAVNTVCRALRASDSVVLFGTDWTPMIRGQCRLPVAQLQNPSPAAIGRVAASIRSVGRTPVFAGSAAGELSDRGLAPQQIVALATRQDQHQLLRRPTGTDQLDVEFWMARP